MFPVIYLSYMKDVALEPLQQIERQWGLDLPGTSIDQIKFLKRELGFLDIFLIFQGFTDLRDMLDVEHKVQSLFQDAEVDLKKVHKIEHVARVTSQLQDKIWMTKLEIRDVYSFPRVSANKDAVANPTFVMRFIDTVIANLGDLVNIIGTLEVVFKELKLLRNFVCFVSDRCIEPHSQHTNFFTHVLLVVGHAAIVSWLYLPRNDNENQDLALSEMNVLLSNLLRTKIKPIQPDVRRIYIDVLQVLRSSIQSQGHPIERLADCRVSFVETLQHYLEELPTIDNPSWTVALKDQIAELQEMLGLLIDHLSIQDLLEFHLQDIETVMVDSGLLVYSLYEDVTLGEATLDFPGTIQRIKAVIYHIIRKEFQSNLPRIHGLGFVDFLLNNLKEFQVRYSDSLDFVKTELQIIHNELDSLQPFIKSVTEEGRMKHKTLQHSVALVIGKAYEVEYIVDACVSNKYPDWCLMLWLLDLIKEIKAEVEAIKILEVDLMSHDTMDTETFNTSSVLASTQRIDEEIVGFEDEIEKLRLKLIGGPKERETISIVGMPGAGKTTLANRLYYDKSVVSHFDIRAHCYVSSVYSRKELLRSLLAMLPVSIDDTSPLSKDTNDLAVMLRRILFSRRYLILIDDVWDARAWHDLEPCFYDANNGSRILLTTRHHNVARDANSVTEPLHLRVLDDDESWKLLKKKVFGKKNCSLLLEKVGVKIAGKCGGLPLSIVFVASILARRKKTEECWKRVVRSLGSKIICYPEDIIELSYQNLPYHLKSLFLYFGIFSDHQEINFSNLTLLWIGEGFVKDDKEKSLENIAEGYLENLVESNLAMVSKRSSGGKVKECRIHDILLHFCKERAQKENFIQRIERCQRDIYSPKKLNQRRLAFYTEVDNLVQWSVSCSLVGSALFRKATFLSAQFFHKFKLLKVLDLECTVIHSFPTELVYLRYFAAQTDCESIASSIANMRNLQTLIVRSLGGELALPITIWEIVKLRHLHVDKADFTLNGANELLENYPKCNDLGTLSCPFFSCAEDVELILRKSPNLRELRCSFVGFKGTRFPVLDFLTRLETLKILCAWGSISGAYVFPSNLKSLTLNNFHLGCYHSSNLATLPGLQVLKLESILFDKNKWEMNDDEFTQLKVLKIVNCHFRQWIVDDDAFPSLERLVLRECKYLEEIPSCFENISSIKSIEVKYCNKAVDKSAREIEHTRVEDLEYFDFKVFISSRRRMCFSEEEDDNTGVAADYDDEEDDEDEVEDDDDDEEEDEEDAEEKEVLGFWAFSFPTWINRLLVYLVHIFAKDH